MKGIPIFPVPHIPIQDVKEHEIHSWFTKSWAQGFVGFFKVLPFIADLIRKYLKAVHRLRFEEPEFW